MSNEDEETGWRPNSTGFAISRYVSSETVDGFAYTVTWENSLGEIDIDTREETPDEGAQDFETMAEALEFGIGLIAAFDEMSDEWDAEYEEAMREAGS